MAEIVAAATSIISIVSKLSEGLYKEANFLLGAKGGIEKLRKELRYMQCSLKDVDELEMNNLFREWVSDVTNLAYDAEDIIDTFFLTSGSETHAGSWCIPIPCSTFGRSTRTLRSQLENLMSEAKEIDSRRERYANLCNTSDRRKTREKLKELRVDSSYATDEYMVGLAETIHFLQGKLTSGGSDRFVMSILGMGGLGKTTLARKLYNILSKLGQFHLCAWVCVSQEYDTKNMLLELIKSIINPERKVLKGLTTTHSMEACLRNYLKEHCFLLVIDDVWETRAWESLHRAFPQNNINSRIIITTRKREVAQINGAYVHELRYLNENESWELFCRKSFQDDDVTKCPADLEKVGREMVKKCAGLPLALVTLGGLLSRKSSEISEWEAVSNKLWDALKKGSDLIDVVLTFSYIDLSYNLKQCFLYMGMFPEDPHISTLELTWLWEAEGLIGQEEGGRPEDIAKSYFIELVGRSLLQIVGVDLFHPSCRMHDLLRDLAITKAKEIRFSAFYDANQPFDLLNKVPPYRRLAMSYLHRSTIPRNYTNGSLRTFRLRAEVSNDDQSPVSSYISVNELVQSIDGRFNLLRVLDIAVLGSITNLQLGKMIHLKYLGIKCKSVKLPETIGNLKALQTISIRSGNAVILPKTMVKLQNLKHIIGSFHFGGDWIGKLKSLETLEFKSNKWCEVDTSNLVNLRRLTIRNTVRHKDSKFYLNFGSLTKLHTLVLYRTSETPADFVSQIFKSCPSITHFRSKSYGSDNGDMLKFAINLVVLEVFISDDILLIAPTERLSKLRALRLFLSRTGPMRVMTCSKDGFPQLRTLVITFNQHKETGADMELKVAEGGMPLLTNLHVNMPEQLIAPERLKKLITMAH